MSGYLNDGVLLYVNQLIDWDSFYRWSQGRDVDTAAERDALVEILETAAGVCSEIESSSRECWDQVAELENGQVVYPEHIQKG